MQKREEFENTLQEVLADYQMKRRAGIHSTSENYLFEDTGLDFDVDTAFIECAKTAGVNYVVIDVATATSNDIETIIANWNTPTAYLFKNYGDESAGNIRNKISFFMKDRDVGICASSDSEPQVAFCGATVTKEKPIRDFNERQAFSSIIEL